VPDGWSATAAIVIPPRLSRRQRLGAEIRPAGAHQQSLARAMRAEVSSLDALSVVRRIKPTAYLLRHLAIERADQCGR